MIYSLESLTKEMLISILTEMSEVMTDYAKIRQGDKLDVLCSAITPGKPLTVIICHENGSQERIQAKHSYTPQQIAWFRAGSALNTLSK